jgi:hypothetical protein
LGTHLLVDFPVRFLAVFATVRDTVAFGTVLHVRCRVGARDASGGSWHFEVCKRER